MRSSLCIFISGLILVCAADIEAQEFICSQLDDWKEETTRAVKQADSTIPEGEPRMVRGVYLLPNDRQFRQEAVDSIKSVIEYAQVFFGLQMESHGYGYKTFQFEADDEGRPTVIVLQGEHSSDYYDETLNISDDISFGKMSENVFLIAIDHGKSRIGGRYGLGRRSGKRGGATLLPFPLSTIWACHELGHAFGLNHDFRDGSYVMSYGESHNGNTGQDRLSRCAAEFIHGNPLINPDIPIEYARPRSTTAKLVSPDREPEISYKIPEIEYPVFSIKIFIKMEISDSNGLHQIQMSMQPNGQLKFCYSLGGVKNTVARFNYDGVPPFYGDGISLASSSRHRPHFRIMNTKGDLIFPSYVFVEKPPDPDFNGDGLITLDDFFMFAERFGAKQGDELYDPIYDLNRDREIGLDDFWIFSLAFGS